MKRRQAPQPVVPATGSSDAGDDKNRIYNKNDIPELMTVFLQSTSTETDILKALQGFRRMLSVEANPPVEEVLQAGALEHFARFLKHFANPTMVFEAAWTLTNIASTDKTRVVVDAGIVPDLVALLTHGQANIREQAAWCLGNIAGDSYHLRDLVLQAGALEGLVMNLNEPGSNSLLSNVAWTVSNLCRGKPAPDLRLISPAVGPLATLLRRDVSQEVLVDTLWALSYLADGENERIQVVMDTGVTPTLVSKLETADTQVLTPLVRTLGNFVTGTDQQTQAVLDAGVLPYMTKLVEHPNKNLRKEACWLLSNIAAGSHDQLNSIFQYHDLLERVVELARTDRWEVRKEALWVVCNMFTTGQDNHVRSLVQGGGFTALAEALSNGTDTKILVVVLEAVEEVLKLGSRLDLPYTTMFDELGGLDKLEQLQEHQSEEIYEKSVELLEQYFGVEEDDDENLAPANDGEMFGFGMSNAPAKQLFPEGSTEDRYAPVLGQANFDFSY